MYIGFHYKKKKAREIGDELGLTINQVYDTAKKHGFSQPQNIEVKMNHRMNQIILSGIIGDGRLKRNGSQNYYYSECHAMGESEYVKWKFDNLGELTDIGRSNGKLLYGKNNNNHHSDALEFTTLTTPTLIKYAEMEKEDVIKNLDDLGLILLILDDGWTQRYKSGHRTMLSISGLRPTEKILLKEKYEDVFKIEGSLFGIKRVDLGFKASDESVFIKTLEKYNLRELDVSIKKYGI